MSEQGLPRGLKHPGGGLREPIQVVEFSYVRSDRATPIRVHMSERAAPRWFEIMRRVPQVIRLRIRRADGTIVRDETIVERVRTDDARTQATLIDHPLGRVLGYTEWSPECGDLREEP